MKLLISARKWGHSQTDWADKQKYDQHTQTGQKPRDQTSDNIDQFSLFKNA